MSAADSSESRRIPPERNRSVTRSTARAALAALAAFAVSSLLAGCSIGQRPLARVGSRTITSADLLDAARGNELQYRGTPEQAKLTLLQDLVRRELMLEAAHRRGSDTTAFARNYLASLEGRYALEALYAKLAPKDPGVSEAEAHRLWQWRGTQAVVRVIYSPDRTIIASALRDLANGVPFAAVADRHNIPGTVPSGGLVGNVRPGQLVPPLDEALLTLEPGKVGGPYDTPQGVFLMVVESRAAVERPSFELEHTQLTEMLRQRKVRQTMVEAMIGLKEAAHVNVEKGAAQRLFRLLTPARIGDLTPPAPTADERAETLARWDGGRYTLGDALDDLSRPDVQKPPAGLTPAIQQWIEGRVITRVAREEARRRHLLEEPEVNRRVRGEYERYLLEGEFQASIADVPPPGEAQLRQIWAMVQGQYQQVSRANIQWVILPDSATAARIGMHGGHGGATLEEAVRRAGVQAIVHHEVVNYPTSDPNWITMRETLARMQPGEWAGPEHLREGFRLMQVVGKAQEPLTFENLTPDLRANLLQNAMQLAQEQRLARYTDSLQSLVRPVLLTENLRSVPWPPPATIDVGN